MLNSDYLPSRFSGGVTGARVVVLQSIFWWYGGWWWNCFCEDALRINFYGLYCVQEYSRVSFVSIRLSEKYYATLPLVDTKRANQE